MSREKSLQKAIVLSLMLTNIWCGAAYAANGADGADGTNPPPKTDAIGSSGLTADYTDSANNGTDGSKGTSDGSQEIGGGKGGNGGSISASHTVSGTLSGAIAITAAAGSGGKGGDSVYAQGDKNYTFGGSGGSGGNVELGLTVTGAVLDGNQNITLTATGGSGGNGGQSNGYGDTLGSDRNNKGGQGGKGGDASAKGLILTGDAAQTTVTVANITITATGGKGGNNGSSYDAAAIVPGSGGAAAAYGITSVAAGKATITAANITVEAAGGSGGDAGAKNSFFKGDTVPEIDNGGEAKATMAYGLQAQNGEIALTAQAVSVTATGGKGGAGSGSSSVNNNTGFDPSGASLAALKGGVGAAGGAAYAAAFDLEGGTADLQATTVASSAAGGVGGDGGKGAQSYHGDNLDGGTGGAGGVGGTAEARGLSITAGGVTLQAASVVATATGGVGGVGGAGANGYEYGAPQPGNGGNGGQGGNGGNAVARAVYATGGAAELTVAGTITATAIGGVGGVGGNCGNGANFSAVGGAGGNGGIGGTAYAYGVLGSGASNMQVKAADIIVSGIGGDGGMSGSSYKNVVLGRNGGAAEAYGICAMNSMVDITAANIQTTATGGKGGTGSSSSFGSQGAGGDGGNAYAYGVQSSGGTVTAATDKITAKASGGAGGNGGGYIGGTIGAIGSIGAEAKAYGIYVENGAVVHLRAKTTNGTIKIGAKADNAQNTEAYAVYADKATVIFHDNATLNTNDGSTDDNTVLTYLKDATLGFGGTDANRTVTGGKLQLTDSNAFRFTTDLANGKADSMTFDTIENNSSKQYIQIGYEEAFKDALSKEDIVTITGSATVLTINNLNGQNLNNFTGQASRLDSPLERFKVTPTVDVVDNKVNITEIALAKENSPSETAMAASDAQMAMGSMWRIEGNNLMKRMGELRSDKEAAQGGVWARYYRGELSADSAYDRNYSQDYTAFQGGIDKVQDYKGGKLYTGIAINRIDSKAGYTAGSGDLSSTGVGLYASWLGSKGHYVDVIARGSKLANDFKLVDLSGNSAKADYDTWAYGISAEYGYRQNLNAGWFVEPQAELSLGRIGSVDYTTSNDVTIKQDSVNSAVVRLGFLGGKEFTIGGRTSNAYVKASALHDFGGDGGATGYYENTSLALQTGDLTGTWYEIGLGANLGIAKNSNLYFDALKTFGGNLRTDWQFNAGLRFSF